jgi:hypothetical protein
MEKVVTKQGTDCSHIPGIGMVFLGQGTWYSFMFPVTKTPYLDNTIQKQYPVIDVVWQYQNTVVKMHNVVFENKSSVAPIRCSEINLDEVLQNFDGDRVSFPITYLGLPVTLGQLKLVHLQPMIDRAASKMMG